MAAKGHTLRQLESLRYHGHSLATLEASERLVTSGARILA
jgi:hypothetical protein